MEKIKLLVVDDHTLMREGIRALISLGNDMEIIGEAADGREALDKVQQLSPDVILMDIAMPNMDGLEATRRIKRIKPDARVLILSEHDSREHILAAIKAGISGYIPKKALGSELIAAIRTVSSGHSFLYPSVAAILVEDYRHQADREPYDQLTVREREVLKLIADGCTSREIAETLIISQKTVLGHRSHLMEKLGLRNRTELIKYALRKGLMAVDA